jgi:KDO2-lipid IV(A) lauroyltransferase
LFHRIKEIKQGLKYFSKGGHLAFIADQDGLREGEYLYFFDRLVSAPPGVAKMSKKYGIIVLPVSLRYAWNKPEFLIEFGEPFYPKDMQEIYVWYEKIILQYPEQWLWLYQRWKKRRHVVSYAKEHNLPLFKIEKLRSKKFKTIKGVNNENWFFAV